MSSAFEYCLRILLGHEGGEVNHAADPGGHTNLGITQRTLDRARGVIQHLPASVSSLTLLQAKVIYDVMYWRPIHGDALPLGLALLAFDACVNQGEGDAKQFLQKALRVKVDGQIGPRTLAAAARAGRAELEEYAALRMHDYMLLDHLDDTFGLGWSRRLCRVFATALLAEQGGA
ncbi:glycosyl hydrolase 108 family protein [Marilutibacter spongiae]|uniref:Secretion activator protein n=1 Tax=Marilutibacter spongiae TaxID=2025720 RepID=A0A7W3Y7A9_9GAMM|nr:hypothetical protein [Lysobacter spongiae]